jgi:hypothetical protein
MAGNVPSSPNLDVEFMRIAEVTHGNEGAVKETWIEAVRHLRDYLPHEGFKPSSRFAERGSSEEVIQ